MPQGRRAAGSTLMAGRWPWGGAGAGTRWHSQGLVPQGLQLAPVLLPELRSPLSRIRRLRLAGHGTLHHLPTAGSGHEAAPGQVRWLPQ